MKETGFSLASIFFLTAVVAIFASGVRMATSGPNPIGLETLGAASFFGVIVGALVGGFIGSRIERSKAAGALAVFAGVAVGPPSMILSVTGGALPVVVVGSAVLLIFVWVVRRLSSRPLDEEPS
jgi:hypothetical protein